MTLLSDSTRSFRGKLIELRHAGLSVEEIATKILAAEPETAECWIRALIEIAFESTYFHSPEVNA